MSETKNSVYPHRPPKKYPNKSLHGRTRFMILNYKDFKRFQNFYVNVFGWDLFELPVAAGGMEPGSDKPSLLIATGPSYETWEGAVAGHMNVMASYTEGELVTPHPHAEVHMDRPIAETLRQMEANGATIVGGSASDAEGWTSSAEILDPSGNLIGLWKCPSSRTWDECEAGYDND